MKSFDVLSLPSLPGVSLEKPAPADFDFIRSLLQNPRVMSAQGGPWGDEQLEPFFEFLERHWRDHGFGHYLINDNGQNVGVASLKLMRTGELSNYDLGFMVDPTHWGRGVGTAAARRLIEFAFTDLGLEEVSALTLENQRAGVAVLAKLGFARAGESTTRYAGREWAVTRWTLTKS